MASLHVLIVDALHLSPRAHVLHTLYVFRRLGCCLGAWEGRGRGAPLADYVWISVSVAGRYVRRMCLKASKSTLHVH